MKKLFFLAVFATGLLLVSCGDDDDPMTGSCDTTGMTYNNDIASILNTSCALAGCHVTGSQATFPMDDFSTTSVAVGFDRIVGAINHETGFTPMPFPSGTSKIDQCNIDKITAWIADGAPE